MAKGYIYQMETRDGDDVYPVTKADAVYLQETSSDGTTTQQKLSDKLKAMTTSFQAGVDTIVAKFRSLGVTPSASTPDGIAAAAQTMYNNQYTAGQNSVTVSTSVSGRTVTARTSTGKTASSSVALGTDNGSHTFTLTPTGDNTATKVVSDGYYYSGTITANGSTAYNNGYAAGKAAAALKVTTLYSEMYLDLDANTGNGCTIDGLGSTYQLFTHVFPVIIGCNPSNGQGYLIDFIQENNYLRIKASSSNMKRVGVTIYLVTAG